MPDTITRDDLLNAVEAAADAARLRGDHRAAVLEYAQRTPRVAAGAWSVEFGGEVCRCPIAGAGIDRFREDAGTFALRFDRELDVDGAGDPHVFVVVDEEQQHDTGAMRQEHQHG